MEALEMCGLRPTRRGPRPFIEDEARDTKGRRSREQEGGMHMPTAQKEAVIAEIKGKLTGSSGVILADYRGLTVKEMQALRARLREAGAELKVYKNTLTELALRELSMPDMDDMLAGPTAFAFTEGDPVAPAKALMEFAKVHKALEVKGGFIECHVVDAASVLALASLPSRDQLVAQLMGAMVSPIRGFMYVANAPVGALARALRAVAEQKEAA
jgi:large subunit ribosomal protein L10